MKKVLKKIGVVIAMSAMTFSFVGCGKDEAADPAVVENVEKSKVSSDKKNLDVVETAVTDCLAYEDIYDEAVPSKGDNVFTLKNKDGKIDLTFVNQNGKKFPKLSAEVKDIAGDIELKSNEYKDKDIVVTITDRATVTVTTK